MQTAGDGRRWLRICALLWGMSHTASPTETAGGSNGPTQREDKTFLKQRRLGLQKNRLDRFNRPAPVAEDHQRPLSSHGSASGTEFDPCQRSPAGNFKGYTLRRNPFQFFRARSGQFAASISPVDRLTHSRAAVPSWRPMPSVAARFIAILRRHAAARPSGRAAAALAAERSS
jgi:hypothetical protein